MPYVRRAVKLRYPPGTPPPKDPPMPLEHGVGVWRVAVMWWHDHQPDPGRLRCRTCYRAYPCPTMLTADGLLDTFHRRATATGRAPVVWNPRSRNV